MKCPHCNLENNPEALYCSYCGALLPSPAEEKRQKRYAVAAALAGAVAIPLLYAFVMNIVLGVWTAAFVVSSPAEITDSRFSELYMEAFNRNSAYLNMLSACIFVLATAVFFALKKRPFVEAVGLRSASPVKIGSAFVCGLTLQIPIGIIISLIPFSESIMDNHSEVMNSCTSPMWIQLMYAVIIAPIIEEILFRGIVHDRLAKAVPLPLAVAVSSAVFGVIHGETISIIVAFACGCVLAVLYSKFNTILVPIGFHMGFNLLSYIVPYINDPVLLTAATVASVGLLVGAAYLLITDKSEGAS